MIRSLQRTLSAAAILPVSAWMFLASCTTAPSSSDISPPVEYGDSTGRTQEILIQKARSLVGQRDRIVVGGTRFNADCSGTILAVFFAAGLDLRPAFNRSPGNGGVEKIYSLMESSGLLEDTDLPQPGSLVFWDDTYDKNGDGKKNDSLTHVGIVVSAESNGNLHYVHYHYRNGVVEEYMSIRRPALQQEKSGGADVIVNSPLRMKSWKPDAKSLAGELYRISARAYEYDAGRVSRAF